jgi:hypothetical protein
VEREIDVVSRLKSVKMEVRSMPITWEEFNRRYKEVFAAERQMKSLAAKAAPDEKSEYLRLGAQIVKIAGELLESTGVYVPNDLSGNKRDVWRARKSQLEKLRLDVIRNQHRWWSENE